MIRAAVAASVFALGLFAALSAGATGQQPDAKKQPPGKFDPPKLQKPDDATMKQIAEKTEQLRKAVAALKEKKLRDDVLIEVEIYLKAAENIVRFDEWFHANSGKWALTTLDQGLERAKQAAEWDGKALNDMLWRATKGKWVVRAYRSSIDSSIQPYAVMVPHNYGDDPKKKWPLEVILHGRDSSLTEAKFIATHTGGKAAPETLDRIQLEVYGRGNNAYRWAGEEDVFEAMDSAARVEVEGQVSQSRVDNERVLLRGFSMGGAGTWHIGLHRPGRFCVIGPGAGFTTTHGYVANLPEKLPDYQEKCLHIYDAVDYVENAFNVPIVAYSGENDPQKKAADNIENLLKQFKERVRFTHLVAPGLEHVMPPEWQQKADAEYRKYVEKGRDSYAKRVRFVTYTPRYHGCEWVWATALERTYEKAVVDARRDGDKITVTTTNLRELSLHTGPLESKVSLTIDGQKVPVAEERVLWVRKIDGTWKHVTGALREERQKQERTHPEKSASLCGPIDDAFRSRFWVVPPAGAGWHAATDKYATAAVDQFAAVWDRYFRGKLPMGPKVPVASFPDPNRVLFGDPGSNPKIAAVLPHLPITWTKDELVVNGVKYDPKTHLPVLIYPYSGERGENPTYIVLNSGHTFKEADLKGTNALLYPRLGDWAVIKPTPTDKDPAAYEVVAAGLFDENWQFPKK